MFRPMPIYVHRRLRAKRQLCWCSFSASCATPASAAASPEARRSHRSIGAARELFYVLVHGLSPLEIEPPGVDSPFCAAIVLFNNQPCPKLLVVF